MNQVRQSRLVTEDKVYVKFDNQGNTQLVKNQSIEPGFSYRRVHDTHQQVRTNWLPQAFKSKDLFLDSEYSINESELSSLDPNNSRVIVRRLSDLIRRAPKSQKIAFFPPKGYIPPRKLSSNPYLPTFATQMGVFPVEHYKSFFLTQQFSQTGFYHMIINQKGRFETDVVDDLIPVYQNSNQPIWGMDIDQAWQIILLKFWAKRSGGYHNVKNAPAYNFLECFSNSNWKYFNLQRQSYDFLNFYTGKTNIGKFVLKTKSSSAVLESGLIPGSAGYEIVNIVETTPQNLRHSNTPQDQTGPNRLSNSINHPNPKQRSWILTIRSTMVNKWSGAMSVLDREANKLYNPQQYTMNLDRDFMMNHNDFVNLFSTCYIASKRDQKQRHYISNYHMLRFEPNNKNSAYLKFEITKNGWLDFCIKQIDGNKVAPTNQSRVRTQQFNKNEGRTDNLRYLKCRFILVKQNNSSSPSTFLEPEYTSPAYDTYQIEYLQGYNRGDARFLQVVKGTYILKIKPENVGKTSTFVVNYASDNYIEMKQHFPTKAETSAIMRNSMASLIGLMTSYHLDKQKKHDQIVFGNVFQEIGYGFIGVRSKKICPYRILIQVQPKELQGSGYKIKNQFKRMNDPFSILVNPGDVTSIVLKKIPNLNNYVWPPKGIEIFRQK